MLTHSRLKRFGPVVLVVMVAMSAVVGLELHFTRTSQEFAFSAYWPQPGAPTGNDADVVLWINYTGPSPAYFTYVISYNSTAGTTIAGQNRVLVGNSPFRAYVSVPVPAGGVVATAAVYQGAVDPSSLVFSKSLVL